MKSAGEAVEILEAFDLTGSLRDAAELADCSPNTVARYVRLRTLGRPLDEPVRRSQLIDPYLAKVEEWVEDQASRRRRCPRGSGVRCVCRDRGTHRVPR